MIRNILRNEDGATAIEYGLIAALVAVAAITSISRTGARVSDQHNCVRLVMAQGAEKAKTRAPCKRIKLNKQK